MKLKFYTFLFSIQALFIPTALFSQFYDCNDLQVQYVATESRCTATGSITVTVTGGSGNYNYKVAGPVNTLPTSSNLISGLPPGTYSLTVDDIVSECTKTISGIVISGSYVDPGFGLLATDVTCNNGTDGTITVTGVVNGRAPFQYTIIAPSASAIGTTNSTGVFTDLVHGNYFIEMRDSCGGIQTRNVTIQNYDWSIQSRSVTMFGCDSADIILNLIDNKGNTNDPPDLSFTGFTYGAVLSPGDTVWSTSKAFRVLLGTKREMLLVAKDRCGNMKMITWFRTNKPSAGPDVDISNLACSTFSAIIHSPVNLTNPQYCLYNETNDLITCNTTGVFDNLPFGTYSINISDVCYDTVIVRNVTQNKPVPTLGVVTGGNFTCTTFTATVTAQSNLSNPQFCLYDSVSTLIECNSTGIFTGLTYGSYCIKMQNDIACYDTLIERCFTITKPLPSVGETILITNRGCTTFTAEIIGKNNLTKPQFCLYDSSNNLIICDSTGVFTNLLYGSYCIKTKNDASCYDTTITTCFTVTVNKPSVGASVSISNKNCSSFSAGIYGQFGLTNPQYCLYNNTNTLVSCNTDGQFSNIPFGSYCIKIVNDVACYDTTIERCFSVDANPSVLALSQRSRCQLGFAEIHPQFASGTAPYTIQAYGPSGNLIMSVTQASYYFTFILPDLAPGQKYTFIGTDNCGAKDTIDADPFSRIITKSFKLTKRCPGGSTPIGSSDLLATVTSNEGSVTPSIIKKDAANVTINYTISSGNTYTFSSLEPATYIVRYNYTYTYPNGDECDNSIYDTITVTPYNYPDLANSSAYQCDNNSFSVSAAVSGGIAPYTYEIIGSVPAFPSIATAPQVNPLFSINNGVQYDLVRLRTIDACGNATLGDVSVLPLANLIVAATGDCYYNNINLSVRDIPTATYTWYKKTSVNDSVEVGTGRTLNISYLLPSDTGMYVCKTNINDGCLIRLNYKHVTGNCYAFLDNEKFVLTATKQTVSVELKWAKAAGQMVDKFIIERQVNGSNNFVQIGIVEAGAVGQTSFYQFTDDEPGMGIMYYRIKVITADGRALYSNVALVTFSSVNKINVFPNPVTSAFVIAFNNAAAEKFNIELVNMSGQSVMKKEVFVNANGNVTLLRNQNWGRGIYLLKIAGKKSGNAESILLNVE